MFNKSFYRTTIIHIFCRENDNHTVTFVTSQHLSKTIDMIETKVYWADFHEFGIGRYPYHVVCVLTSFLDSFSIISLL